MNDINEYDLISVVKVSGSEKKQVMMMQWWFLPGRHEVFIYMKKIRSNDHSELSRGEWNQM